jgi:D-3-phosphoglycerate dehydrogenase
LDPTIPTVVLLEPCHDPAVRAEMAGVIQSAGGRLVDASVLPTGPGVIGLIPGPGTPVDAAAVGRLPDLRVVAAPCSGVDHLDIEALVTGRCWVTNVADYCTEEVADHALALIVSLLRGIAPADRQVRAGRWGSPMPDPRRLSGTRLGLVGFGRVAQALARRAAALGMDVAAHDRHGSRLHGSDPPTRLTGDLDQLLSWADVISLHVPLTAATRQMIDAPALARMQPGAFLINVARGGLVDPEALDHALRAGRLGGAGLDVLDTEPPAGDDLLLTTPGVVLTPHMAWQSAPARRLAFVGASASVAAVLAGREPFDIVHRPTPIPTGAPPDDL